MGKIVVTLDTDVIPSVFFEKTYPGKLSNVKVAIKDSLIAAKKMFQKAGLDIHYYNNKYGYISSLDIELFDIIGIKYGRLGIDLAVAAHASNFPTNGYAFFDPNITTYWVKNGRKYDPIDGQTFFKNYYDVSKFSEEWQESAFGSSCYDTFEEYTSSNQFIVDNAAGLEAFKLALIGEGFVKLNESIQKFK
jgi:hypothetical protein